MISLQFLLPNRSICGWNHDKAGRDWWFAFNPCCQEGPVNWWEDGCDGLDNFPEVTRRMYLPWSKVKLVYNVNLALPGRCMLAEASIWMPPSVTMIPVIWMVAIGHMVKCKCYAQVVHPQINTWNEMGYILFGSCAWNIAVASATMQHRTAPDCSCS